MDVRRDIERGLACYGRGAVREALDAWRQALVHAPRNEEAKRLVELVEQRLVSARSTRSRAQILDDEAAPQSVVENDLTPVSPISAWLAPSTHPTKPELIAFGEEGAPLNATHDVTTEPMFGAKPSAVERPRSSASDRTAFQLDQCRRFMSQGDAKSAAAAAELALQAAELQDDAEAWALIGPGLSLIERSFYVALGSKHSVPFVVKGVRSLDANSVDHRTGFLLSCVDGFTDIGTLLDICGMPRLEALRVLAGLYHRGFLRMR